MAFEYSFPPCSKYVAPIRNSERLGNSLIKINNNFANLQSAYCDLLDDILRIVQIRTFFYYGPNSHIDPTSNMRNNQASYPNNNTILNFVNSTSQLNLPTISRPNDVAYVIYQKTGFYSRSAAQKYSDTLTVNTASNIASEKIKYVTYTDLDALEGRTPDTYNVFSPVFVVWRLTAQRVTPQSSVIITTALPPVTYTVDNGFPKFTQAETIANTNWDKPNLWTEYQL
jgi:hypothetical protein